MRWRGAERSGSGFPSEIHALKIDLYLGIDQKLEAAIRRSLVGVVGIGKTARIHSVGPATVQRIKAELSA
jgi:hypothetical protein